MTVGAADASGVGFLVGFGALFLAVFMLKPIFFVRRGDTGGMVEISAQEQPRLFAFLYELADRAEAPRPHRVYLSARVNASVFYDLSLLNLVVPSKKNLEVGLALVNALSLGELRAVLAHEFGHFTQRSMAVGQWAYLAQQIAAHLVARRDKLDAFLDGLSRLDLRIAWIGWGLGLIVWSIRSLVDSAFRLVVRLQHALSREMEMHADLVAVSLTGSDAIIHALRRLLAADDSWDRTLAFLAERQAGKHLVRDAFTIHSEMLAHMEAILGDIGYGRPPAIPADRPAEHRVFTPSLAQPPRMWLTHPPNDEREANAKRRYVAQAIDDTSSWTLFDDPERDRERVTAAMLSAPELEAEPLAESLAALRVRFDRESLKRRYHGAYLGRSITRAAPRADALADAPPAKWRDLLDGLYPETLSDDMRRWRSVGQELQQLRGLQSGALKPPGGVLRFRGETVAASALPGLIARVEREARSVEEMLLAGDRQRRAVHLAAAAERGEGWESYLRGLMAVLHYAEHTAADLGDLHGRLAHVVHLATLGRRVSAAGVDRILDAARPLHDALGRVCGQHGDSARVQIDEALLRRLGAGSWAERVGAYTLPRPEKSNLGQWLNVIDGWAQGIIDACGQLREAALEQLLRTETALAGDARAYAVLGPAPAPPTVPPEYAVLVTGAERKRDTDLAWWDRVQVAHGPAPTAVRFTLAAGIIAAFIGVGRSVHSATVSIYNGLALHVVVHIGPTEVRLAPRTARSLGVGADGTYIIETRTGDGRIIERFQETLSGSFAKYAYDVAGAAPLVQWTAVYGQPDVPAGGKPVSLGIPRWSRSAADFLFTDPPERLESSGSGTTRSVLSATAALTPGLQVDQLTNPEDQRRLIRVHARWDPTQSPGILSWLSLAAALPDARELLAQRLAQAPNDVVLLREEQDAAQPGDRQRICERDRARAAAAPDDPDLHYLAARCIMEPADRDRVYAEGHRRWPANVWLAYGAGYAAADAGRWREAIAILEGVPAALPPLAEATIFDLARLHRMADVDPGPAIDSLAAASERLRVLVGVERGQRLETPTLQAYAELERGEIDSAVALAGSDSGDSPRLLRLAASSEGASSAIVSRALALDPPSGLDDYSRWSAIALATRLGRPIGALLDSTKVGSEAVSQLNRFLDLLRKGRAPDSAAVERLLSGLPLVLRGEAYGMGVILLGDRAPSVWRRATKRLLFAGERPYFR